MPSQSCCCTSTPPVIQAHVTSLERQIAELQKRCTDLNGALEAAQAARQELEAKRDEAAEELQQVGGRPGRALHAFMHAGVSQCGMSYLARFFWHPVWVIHEVDPYIHVHQTGGVTVPTVRRGTDRRCPTQKGCMHRCVRVCCGTSSLQANSRVKQRESSLEAARAAHNAMSTELRQAQV